MGTISDKLMRIINTKEDIRQALISKGYDVPTSIPFKEYAKMISDLPCRVDSFPDIEGIVARYSALGLTNEQMAANPVWVDKTGNGHDIQLKNFSWKGMSGVGGYVQDFNYFRNNVTVDKVRIDEQSSNSIKVTILTTGIGNAIYIPKNIYQFNKSYFIKISSEGYNEGDLFLSFYAPSTSTATTVKVPLNPNGITEIPAIKEDDFLAVYLSVGGKVGSITIEQLPLYPGALVFDGVDDYGTCDNFPVLTKEKGYTVVSLRKYITPDPKSYLISNGDTARLAAFLVEGNFPTIQYWNFGAVGNLNYIDNLPYVYQTSKEYNGRSINKGDLNEGVTSLLVCKYGSWHSNAAIWEIVILDHDATEEELTKIKDYFVKTYPWLFFDQAWTVTGKTNEDEDRATIANITGNDNDLVLSNFGFAEGSGYGLYGQNYISYAITNRAVYTKNNSSIHVTKSITAGVNFTESARDVTIPSYRIKVTGIQSGQEMIYRGSNNTFLTNIPSDGIYVLPAVENGSNLGFQFVSYTGDCNITIEQIPEYEGYLVTDGVDDRVVSSSFTLNKDWTIVGNWKMLQPEANKLSGIVKQNSLFIYNHVDGLNISINDAWNFFKLKDIRSVNAICSDGRIYLNDWTEIIDSKQQTVNESVGTLVIGILGNVYTSLAFKNLGFYNNRNLSKDECIKAYNYLQTLKSK